MIEEINKLVLDLIGFDTQNDWGYESNSLKGETLPLLEFVKKRLEKNENVSVDIQEYSASSGKNFLGKRGNLIAYLKNEDLPNVLLQGHVDVVPFGNFVENPLGEETKTHIIGRGSVDMKGAISCMILAFEEIVKDESRMYNPVLLLTSDEEARGFLGISNFVKSNDLKIMFGICGEATNLRIMNRSKGVFVRKIILKGKAAHGSRPYHGSNSIFSANKVITLLKEFEIYANKNLINKDFKSDDVWSHKSTLNLGEINGGSAVNIVPEKTVIGFEMRTVLPVNFYEERLSKMVIDKIKNLSFELVEVADFNPMIVRKNNFTKKLENSVVKEGLILEYGVFQGFTEASILNKHGFQTIIFGPGQEQEMHTANEKIKKIDLQKYYKVLLNFFFK